MSLIHWWPLNGNTKDYGVKNQVLANSYSSVDNSGKIGKCYSFNGSSARLSLTQQETLDYPLTISAWIYPTGLPTSSTQYVFSYNTATGGTAGHAIGFGFYNSSSNLAIWYKGNVTTTSFVLSNNNWYHIALSIDANNNIKTYVNGNLISELTSSSTKPSSIWFTLGARSDSSTGGVGGAAYYFAGKINDARIYNHALSAKEVKEISKGLVLHYNFEDVYVEGTTNLNSANWNAYSSYWTITSQTIDEITLVSQGTSHGTVAIYNNFVKNQLAPSSQITVSGYLYKDGAPYKCTEPTLTPYNGWTTSKFESRSDGYFRYTGSFTNLDSTWIIHTPLFGAPASGTVCKIKNLQWENKDHATPYVNGTRQPGLIYDNSGYGYNGAQVNLGSDLQIVSGSCSGNYCANFNSSCAVDAGTGPMVGPYITVNMFAYREDWTDSERYAIASCTEGGGWNFNNNDVANSMAFLAYRSGYGYAAPSFLLSEMTPGWHMLTGVVGPDGTKIYLDGVLKDTNSNTGTLAYPDSHIFIGTEANGPYAQNSYKFPGKIADFKIYATALSAEDILLEYNRKASIDRNGNLFAPYIKEYEATKNIGELANYYIETQHAFDGRFGVMPEEYYNANFPNGQPGLGTYEQGNLIVTMTSQGIRIYSEPNRDGRAIEGSEWNTWGGFCWSPMKQYRCLIKGHHYRLSWHVKGQSSRAMTDVYWSNQIGWGQYPDASPTVHKAVTQPANFQGEMDCFYDFTIEDDIFKTTGSDVHAGFEPNTSYLAYSAFKIGYTYDFTGPLGTDIYITNLQLHDLTTGEVYKIEKSGIVKTIELVSGRRNSARLHSDGVIDVTDIIEY